MSKSGYLSRNIGDIRVTDLLLLFIFMLLACENILQVKVSTSFAYIDELSMIALLIWKWIYPRSTSKANNLETISLIVACLFAVLGNCIFKIQGNKYAIIIDFVTCIKFFVAFWSCEIVLRGRTDLNQLCEVFSKFAITILFIFGIIEEVFGIGMSMESRMGIRAYMFLFGHPSSYASTVVALIAIIIKDIEHNKPYIFLGVALLVMSMRFKAIGMAIIILLMVTMFSKSKKLSITFISISVILVAFVVFDQINVYFSNINSARSHLLNTSIAIANKHFPLGLGFGTYGSNVTISNYPEYYDELGFNNIFGLSRDNPSYIADSFWPIVIAQFGWFGAIFFCIATFHLIYNSVVNRKFVNCNLWAALIIPLYLMIASSSEAALFNHYAVMFSYVMALNTNSMLPKDL